MTPSLGNIMNKDTFKIEDFKATSIIDRMFDNKNMLLSSNPDHGRYYSFTSIFRGTTFESLDMLRKLRDY